MLYPEIDGVEFAPEYPELVGKRVLITGIDGALGVEIARAFGEARARLVLHALNEGPETVALAQLVAERALDVRLYSGPFADHEAILKFARAAVQSFGGLDAVINVAQVADPGSATSEAEIERIVTDLLALPCLVSKVAANRMRMTMTEGAVLNIVAESRGASPRARMIASVARTALAGLTRSEARAWAQDGIRFNAIAPGGSALDQSGGITSAPDVATLALHLASARGHKLSGLVFEAYCG